MAKLSTKDFYVAIDGTNWSTSIASIDISDSFEELDTTTYGLTAKTRIAGLEDGSVAITFKQDFAAASVNATFHAKRGQTVSIEVRPTSAAVSATNPKLTFTALVTEWPVFSGAAGTIHEVAVTWPITGAKSLATS